jgi:hypothetical protein
MPFRNEFNLGAKTASGDNNRYPGTAECLSRKIVNPTKFLDLKSTREITTIAQPG